VKSPDWKGEPGVKSGSCWSNFICSMEEDVLAEALVRVFIIIKPGMMNRV